MKKLITSLLTILLLMACETENPTDTLNEHEGNTYNTEASRNANKRNVCHKGKKIINVSINAVASHQAHGDAVDMDQDGYFDLENDCGMPLDCDDTDATLNEDCSSPCIEGELEVLIDPDGVPGNEDDYVLKVYPDDLGQLIVLDGSIREIWGPIDEDIIGLPNLDFIQARTDFDGAENTTTIVNQLGDYNEGNYAAKLCADLVANDCDEWYLPSAGELLMIVEQLGRDGTGELFYEQLEFTFHWTSTEQDLNGGVYMVRTGSGALFGTGKGFPEHCRCVRKEEL